jgi:membrane associated rhomboid family serine protease
MLAVAILLLIAGLMGVIMVTIMFGDIGTAVTIAALTAILALIGFVIIRKQISKP